MTYNNDGPIYSVLNGKFGPNGCPQSDDFETYGYCERYYTYGGYGNGDLGSCAASLGPNEQAWFPDEASAESFCNRCVHPSTGEEC
jgi:hypothetical protein